MRIRDRNSAAIIDLHLEIGKETKSTLPTSELTQSDRSLQGSMQTIGNADLEANDHGDSTLWKHLKTFQGSVHAALEICLGTIIIIRLLLFFFHRKTSI